MMLTTEVIDSIVNRSIKFHFSHVMETVKHVAADLSEENRVDEEEFDEENDGQLNRQNQIEKSNSADESKANPSKIAQQLIFNYPATTFKRDPTIDNIIETRKAAIIENSYTRLAQTTSQRIRSSQQARIASAKARALAAEKDRSTTLQQEKTPISIPIQQFEDEKWDDGLKGDFDKQSIASIDKSSLQVYEETCKRLKICPCSSVIRSLNTTHINLANYGLGPRGCAALAVALVRNTSVTSVDLSGNDIGSSGMSHIYQILTENAYIEDYNLANNKLGPKGIRKLASAATQCVQMRSLNIAGNQLSAADIQHLLSKFEDHQSLKYFNISHNLLDEEGGIILAKWLGDNNVLLELDASWCSLRQAGAEAMAKAIGENNKLTLLNLSHNSFGNSVVEILIDSLSRNLTLVELNLEENEISARYTTETYKDPKSLTNGKEALVFRLLQAAATNQSLKQFRLGRNHLDRRCLLIILDSLSKNENISLEELDLTGLSLTLNDIHTIRQQFSKHSKLTLHLESVRYTVEQFANNLLNSIHQTCLVKQITLMDFFTNLDDSYHPPVNTLTYDDFIQSLRRNQVPFPYSMINQIMRYLGAESEPNTIAVASLDLNRRQIIDMI